MKREREIRESDEERERSEKVMKREREIRESDEERERDQRK